MLELYRSWKARKMTRFTEVSTTMLSTMRSETRLLVMLHPAWSGLSSSRQVSQINQGSVQQLCQLCSCIPVWECLVHNWNWTSPKVRVGTRLFCYGRGLVAVKNCWHRHEWTWFGPQSFSHLDIATDITLLAEFWDGLPWRTYLSLT